MYKERRAGENPLVESRAESHEKVDKNKRYKQIAEVLAESGQPMSARQIAVEMRRKGYIPTAERNFTASRLTEMTEMGIVEPVGRVYDVFSNKTVSVYVLIDVNKRDYSYDKE